MSCTPRHKPSIVPTADRTMLRRRVEIGHKGPRWEASLASFAGKLRASEEDEAEPLPPEWQCLSFVLRGGGSVELSAANDVDASLWCVGLRTLLESAELAADTDAEAEAQAGAELGGDGEEAEEGGAPRRARSYSVTT